MDGENGAGGAQGPVVGPPYSPGGVGGRLANVGFGEAPYGALGAALARLWADQQNFNYALAGLDAQPRTVEDLAQIYILGMHGELDELLRRLNWKYHRRERKPPVDRRALEDDLADLTKYVLCLWQLFRYDASSMIHASQAKTDVLWHVIGGEFGEPEPGQPILVIDLDNTVARYTEGLDEWMDRVHGFLVANPATYDMAERYGADREFYSLWKTQWENGEDGGGYLSLKPYERWILVVNDVIRRERPFVVVSTARPAAEAKRVWYDCWQWAAKHLTRIDRMLFLGLERAEWARKMRDAGHPVVALEDSPANLEEYTAEEVLTICHSQPYNLGQRANAKWFPDDPILLVTTICGMYSEQREQMGRGEPAYDWPARSSVEEE